MRNRHTNEVPWRRGLVAAGLLALLLPGIVFAQFSVLSPDDQARLDALKREQARQDAQYQAEMLAARQKLLDSAPLPVASNPLITQVDTRSSGCDDPRVTATLFDVDASGMLQSVTCVWPRPAGPSPSPIFAGRLKALSLFHTLPAPQAPRRVQADISLGRLTLLDVPEQNQVLEVYTKK